MRVSGYGSNPEYLPSFMTDRRGEVEQHILLLDRADNELLAAGSLNRPPPRSRSGSPSRTSGSTRSVATY